MYYLLDSPEYPCRWMGKTPHHRELRWERGVKFTHPVPKPLEGFLLKPLNKDACDHSPELPPYFLPDLPVFRDDLIAAMRKCGATNLDAYDAVILDLDSGKKITNYKAVNLIGLVSAADMKKSKYTVHTQPALIDVDFDSLVIDPSKAHDLTIFRLAESTNAILCHERLVEYLDRHGFEGKMCFLDPAECAV
jgi:hypothetical protein